MKRTYIFSNFSIFGFSPSFLVVILLFHVIFPVTFGLAQSELGCLGNDENWVFCTGFEEGNLDLWDDYDGNPTLTNTLMEHPGPFSKANNHVVRLRAPEGRGGADLVKDLDGTFDRLFARWYVMWEPGYDFDAANHGGGLHAGAKNGLLGRSGYRPTGDDWFSAWVEPHALRKQLYLYTYYRGMYQDCADPMGSCWGDSFPCIYDTGGIYCTDPSHLPNVVQPPLIAGRWYCIEMMMDGGTPSADGSNAGGVLNLWIDGEEIGPWNGLWFRNTPDLKISTLWLNLWHHGEHSVEGIFIDEVVVSTDRIGTATVPTESTSWGTVKGQYR